MERSGSQKALLVISIIEIVCAAIVLIGGIIFCVGAGAIGNTSSAELAASGVTVSDKIAVTELSWIIGIVCILVGIWSLLCGIFGIRAANDSTKVGIVWVFTLIALIICVIGIIASIVQGQFTWSLLVSAIPDAIMFWLANNIKKLNA